MANLPSDAKKNTTAKKDTTASKTGTQKKTESKKDTTTKKDKVTYTPVKYGQTGTTVKEMQKYLVEHKYSVGPPGIDGIFGNYTLAAVKKFQSDNKLKVTGIWDQATQEFVNKKTTDTGNANAGHGRKKKDPKPTLTIKNEKTIVVTAVDGKTYKYTFDSGLPTKITGIGKLTDTFTKPFTTDQLEILRKAEHSANEKNAKKTWQSTIKKDLRSHKKTLPKKPTRGKMQAVYFTTSLSQSGKNAQSVGVDSSYFGLYGRYSGYDSAYAVTENGVSNVLADNKLSSGTPGNTSDTDIVLEDVTVEEELVGAVMQGSLPRYSAEYFNNFKIPHLDENAIIKLSDPNNKNGPKTANDRKGVGAKFLESLYSEGTVRDSLIHTLGLYEGDYYQLLDRSAKYYNRFKMAIPDSQLQRSFAHVFFVKPSCNIVFSEKGPIQVSDLHDSDFTYIGSHSPHLLKELSSESSNQDSDFSMVLSNSAASFSLQDEYIDTDVYGKSYLGYQIAYGRHDSQSKTAGEFVVTFHDDKDLSIYKLFHMWVHYISGTFRGRFKAKQQTIDDHIMDYAGAVYYILTAEDGETILFWSKYYGVFPSTIPSTQYSWSHGTLLSNPTMDVTFKFSFKEDFNVDALVEFNKNAHVSDVIKKGSLPYINTYNKTLGNVGNTWTGAPFIETYYEDGLTFFKLRFRKPTGDE